VVNSLNLTINQFCAAVPCGRTKAYELIADGEVEAIKLGKKTLIPRAELERLQAQLPRMRSRTSGRADSENLRSERRADCGSDGRVSRGDQRR
jgi:excisionase family DNA binding protein